MRYDETRIAIIYKTNIMCYVCYRDAAAVAVLADQNVLVSSTEKLSMHMKVH